MSIAVAPDPAPPQSSAATGAARDPAPPSTVTASVFAVDGRPLVRSGLAATARRAFGSGALALTDLAQASSARVLADCEPELLLLGLRSGDDPAAALASARRIAPIVICVLDSDDAALARAALEADADGYLLSSHAGPDALRATLDQIHAGGKAVPDELRGPRDGAVGAGAITERCREVLRSLADGLHDHEIAARLGISTSSVRKHVANAQERLEARTRTQAVAHAARAGLL
jgi:DNA-binding NarL/FixJ family response regulator